MALLIQAHPKKKIRDIVRVVSAIYVFLIVLGCPFRTLFTMNDLRMLFVGDVCSMGTPCCTVRQGVGYKLTAWRC
jgi:hypothetical protein